MEWSLKGLNGRIPILGSWIRQACCEILFYCTATFVYLYLNVNVQLARKYKMLVKPEPEFFFYIFRPVKMVLPVTSTTLQFN
jgi:hypothetical protein